MRIYLEIFIAGTLSCLLFTRLIIRLGCRFRVYGHSHGGRKQAMMPRLGGLGVFFDVVLAAFLVRLVPSAAHECLALHCGMLMRLLFPVTLVLLLGIYDDVASFGL